MPLPFIASAPLINYPGVLYDRLAVALADFGRLGTYAWSFFMLCLVGLLTYVACYTALHQVNRFASLNFLYSKTFFIILSAVTIVLVRLPNLIHPELNPDESQWIANAATIAIDPKFWVSVDAFTGGPLLVYPLNLIHLFGGSLNYITIRLVGLIVCLLPGILLLYYAFTNFYGDKIARVLILPLVVCIALINSADFIAYNSEHVPTLLIAISIYLYSLIYTHNKFRHVFLLGLVLGLLPYAKLQAVPLGLLFAFFYLTCIYFEHERMNWFFKEAGLFVLGGILPSLMVLAYLWYFEAFNKFYEFYILNNMTYAQTGLNTVEETKQLHVILSRTHEYFVSMLDTRLYFDWPRIVFLLTPVTLLLFRKSIPYNHLKLIILSYLLVLGGVYGIVKPHNYFPHYQVLLLAPAAFFMGAVAGTVYQRANNGGNTTSQKITVAVLLLYLFQPVVIRTFYAFFEGSWGMARITRLGSTVPRTELAKVISMHARPGERMAVWGWAHHLYVETGLIQGTIQPSSYYQLVKGGRQPDFLRIYLHDLKVNQPKVFVDAVGGQSFYFKDKDQYRHEKFEPIANYILRNYNFVSEVNNARLYVRKD